MDADDFEQSGYNVLFLQWLQEWKDDAASKQSNLQYSFANALKSIKRYPLPLYSGYGCSHLQFFGDFTCKRLEKKLTTYLKENKLTRVAQPDPFQSVVSGGSSGSVPSIRLSSPSKSPKKRAGKKPKSNDEVGGNKKSPTKRANRKRKSDALDADEGADTLGDLPGPFPKKARAKVPKSKSAETVVLSQPVVTVSDDGVSLRPVSSSYLTAATRTNVITTVAKTQTILTIGGGGGCTKKTFSSSSMDSIQSVGKQRSASSINGKNVEEEQFTLKSGSFDVVLCVDYQEINGSGDVRSKMDVIEELRRCKVSFHVRNLKVGDFLWIAQEKVAAGKKPRELVLDCIAERKRGDDLATSIKDGRYTDQKYRMKESTIKRVIYIIEDRTRFLTKGLGEQALSQAITNIKVQDGFVVQETANLTKTVEFLLRMTEHLQRQYSTKTLTSASCTDRFDDTADLDLSASQQKLLSFAAFSSVSKANQAKTVSQSFLLQLLALDGISPAKASAIVSIYPTVRALTEAYDSCSSPGQKEILLKDIRFGVGLSMIGMTLSKKLYRLYCTETGFRI